MNIGRIIRAILGVIVVCVILGVVYGWYSQFKSAPRQATITGTAPSKQSTTTAATTGTGVARIDGVNFRVKPVSSSKLIRGLKKGEKVTVTAKEGQWYQVRDSKGAVGWITADADYVFFQPH